MKDFEVMLEKYANLVVKVGVNVRSLDKSLWYMHR